MTGLASSQVKSHLVNRGLALHAEHLIVGAGAAGCTLAWLLRQAGRGVLVLELCDAQVKDKLCGGALGVEAVDEIEAIFGEGVLAELAPARPPHLRNRCLEREVVTSVPFVTLPRKRLDDWLLARCEAAGVEVRDRVRLVSIDEGARVATCENLRTGEAMQIGYDVLVGADGASSAVRRLLAGRRQRLVAAIEGPVLPACEDVVFAHLPAKPGYCWHIPTGDAANAGCMLHGGSAADCRAWLSDFCEDLGVSPALLRGAPIPSGDDVLLRAGKEAWLVGDAAGIVRPLDGGGIHYALTSARLLAASLLGGDPYEEAMRPLVEDIAQMAAEKEMSFFLLPLGIARKGRTWLRLS